MAKYEAESGFCEGWVFDSEVRLGVLPVRVDLLGFFAWYGYAAYGAPGMVGMEWSATPTPYYFLCDWDYG